MVLLAGSEVFSYDRDLLVSIVAFKMMTNHFHLILCERQENGISTFMHKLGTGSRTSLTEAMIEAVVYLKGHLRRYTSNLMLNWNTLFVTPTLMNSIVMGFCGVKARWKIGARL